MEAEAQDLIMSATESAPKRARFLPEVGTFRYHVMLTSIAIFILGPLGGIAATYMNLSLGFFVGGQVLASILGSAVTYGYGKEGRHGANYMQTMAASVAAMSAMGVLVQAMVWLGMDLPPAWQMMLFFGCVGMLGVGIGMLYTPILVDRLELPYPEGLAAANILRALTDKRLLTRSIKQLGSGVGLGIAGSFITEHVALLAASGFGAATLGAGIVVASRIAVPGLVMALIGEFYTPSLRAAGWLAADEPFRKVGFLMGLAMILGAALVDIVLIAVQTVRRVRVAREAPRVDKRPLKLGRLFAWVLFWAVMTVGVGHVVLDQPVFFLAFAIVLAFAFVLINGISLGVSAQNPISSAFVVSVMLMGLSGLRDPLTGIIAASILLVSTAVGCDMQQDRSTGARLGSDRDLQFRYQTIGVIMGAVMSVWLVSFFMNSSPVLKINLIAHPDAEVGHWQSAMTYKFVGALGALGTLKPHQLLILQWGMVFGIVTETLRKLLKASAGYKAFLERDRVGFTVGWLMDAIFLSSPYALSFGGFVAFNTSLWYAAGGVLTSLVHTFAPERKEDDEIPEDMSTMSLIGGGLIAGEALFALFLGLMSFYLFTR